ncbi:DMSO/TMAO reductase YedYZ heme-binding membrane subunit [Natranaerovirga hydrolytica]|uniref:DMSO/TMAO reductase YedYZ heme-binding membrane subunit n=1 Tax=Natranaerovirga hydrolytica TaxID=680378 RepID=A0A4R1N1F1_9FIRM|nr:ferric reductase-like transmembrane domain-containing protein [Natranaerovirga hydrolytica]TCK98742.1 DMSO/TMAO reductase YedYZ heme-binding membrane subunit [Natranaerovirga hydrolytica]
MNNEIFLEGSLELIGSLIFTGILAVYGHSFIKKQKKMSYVIAGVFSLLSLVLGGMFFTHMLEVSLATPWVRVVRSVISGYLPASLFIAVMFAGALPSGNFLQKKLMSARTELSIIATILYLPHTLIYAVLSAPYGIAQLISGEIYISSQLMTWSGVINTVLLIILGITSIDKVKKRMKFKKWKALHRWSYVFYLNCFIHYITLSVRRGAYERVILYIIIYGVYLVMRLQKQNVRVKLKEKAKASFA